MCPTCFPQPGLPADASLSSTGSSRASSPASTVLSKRYDFLPPIPPRFVAFAWRYLARSLVLFAPRRTSAPPGPGVGHPVSPAGISPRKRKDLPSSWGISMIRLHMFIDAGRTADTRPLRCSNAALGACKAKAPTIGLSTLNSMAFELAVYASQCGLLQPHARLASGCWSGFTGRASHPQDSAERFQICFLTSHPPFPSFLAQTRPPLRAGLSSRIAAISFRLRVPHTEVGSRIRSILWRRASPEQEQARLTTQRLA